MKRILIGAALAAAAVTAIPSAANAATCNYDGAAKQMDVRYRSGEGSVTIKAGNTIQFSDAGILRSCFDATTGKAATTLNANKLVVRGFSGSGALSQTTILDETTASLVDLNRQFDMFVLTGNNDRLVVRKGARNDHVRLTDGLGPEVDLDYNNEPDLHMTTANTTVEVDGGAGDDLVDAFSVRLYNTDQVGEAGNDVLVGGKKKDALFGLAGNDTLFTDGDPGQLDIANGGEGTDRGKVDFGSDQVLSIESFPF